ncbi:hypothetical protein BpHYR1_034444 [Brachionus plicatilis]|uniref:G-protein coupled receptors family 1 profile domain-containing protein n=1 Tax=Brachionus plicatilis TaxID=10195 RepID=A0A3M7PF26_BRAPC|nr:hypothetical protein BpHYR1_034444 [Brachionus plicatilis]
MNKLMTKEISIVVILFLWLMSILFSLPFFVFTSYTVENFNGTMVPYCYNDRTSLFARTYSSTFISLFVFIPSVILSLVYVTLIRKIMKINKFQLFNSNQQYVSRIKRNCTENSLNFSVNNSAYGSFLFKNRYSGESRIFLARSLVAQRKKACSNSLTTKHRQTQKYLKQISFSNLNKHKANSLKIDNTNECQDRQTNSCCSDLQLVGLYLFDDTEHHTKLRRTLQSHKN